ncbi:MAG: curli production assembly/transport protein CsgG [Polaromonas sp.]|nr:curli production assembly/transport protein CsgG [Polaromonas sp.]
MSACSQIPLTPPATVKPSNARADAVLTPNTRITRDLLTLPPPLYRVPVGVYAFRDMTGQFKPQPDSSFSNSVTQGAATLLAKTLLDSNWFIPVEREGLQNLLTERRIARAIELPGDKGRPAANYPQLLPAYYMLEGGITGYEQNVRAGGDGANLLGIGADMKYVVDQVTLNLRTVDVRSGQMVNSVSVTKTIYSHSVNASAYKFVAYKTLLQAESGFTNNEPAQLAVKEAIESAVIHLILQGVRDKAWALRNEVDWGQPLVQSYMQESEANILGLLSSPVSAPIPLKSRIQQVMIMPAQQPQIVRPTAAATAPAVLQTPPALTVPQPAPASIAPLVPGPANDAEPAKPLPEFDGKDNDLSLKPKSGDLKVSVKMPKVN